MSQLKQWPIQLKLITSDHNTFTNSEVLIAADCCAFAHPTFHQDFMKDKATIIACPKLDAMDYSDKLAEIFSKNTITKIHIARMEVPCCGGLTYMVESALQKCGKSIEVVETIIGIKGDVID